MKKDVQDIIKVLELLDRACYNIQENDQCEYCPISHLCLDGKYGEATLVDLADLVSVGRWTEFLEFADECLPSEDLQADIDYAYLADYGRDELPDE